VINAQVLQDTTGLAKISKIFREENKEREKEKRKYEDERK